MYSRLELWRVSTNFSRRIATICCKAARSRPDNRKRNIRSIIERAWLGFIIWLTWKSLKVKLPLFQSRQIQFPTSTRLHFIHVHSKHPFNRSLEKKDIPYYVNKNFFPLNKRARHTFVFVKGKRQNLWLIVILAFNHCVHMRPVLITWHPFFHFFFFLVVSSDWRILYETSGPFLCKEILLFTKLKSYVSFLSGSSTFRCIVGELSTDLET